MKQNQTDERDDALRDAVRAALPAAPASSELRARVARMATQTEAKISAPQRKIRTRRARLAWSAIGVACALLLCAALMPRVLTTQAMAQIESAMADVKSARTTGYEIKDGKRVLRNDTWYQNGQWRTQNYETGSVTLWKKGKLWLFNPVANTVTTRNTKGPFARLPRGFTLDALVADFSSNGGDTKVTLLGDATFNGQNVKRVKIVARSVVETTDMTLLVDPKTNLPLRADAIIKSGGGGQLQLQIDLSYNQPLAASLFEPKFARGARFVAQARENQNLTQQMRAGIARRKAGERTIVIRDLQVNRRGDVFVLYTAGKRPDDGFSDGENWFNGRDWKIYLTDSLGTRYHYQRGQQYDPRYYMTGSKPPLFDGQRLHGDWWVPTVAPRPGASWQPRTFTLKFEVNARNLHGANGVKFTRDYSAKTEFKMPIAQANEALTPTTMDVTKNIVSDEQIIRAESEARGELPPGVEPSPELVRTLQTGGKFQWSPDATTLAVNDSAGVALLDAKSGRVLQKSAKLRAIWAFAPDGATALATAADSMETDWRWVLVDAKTLAPRASWRWKQTPDNFLQSVTFAPDNRTVRLVTTVITQRARDDKNGDTVKAMNVHVEERDAQSGQLRFERTLLHDGFILKARSSTGPEWKIASIQTGSKRGQSKVRIWDARSGTLERTLDFTDFDARPLELRGDQLFVAGQKVVDGPGFAPIQVRVFQISTGKLTTTIESDRQAWATILAVSSDAQIVALEGADHTIALYDVASGRLQKTLVGHYSDIAQLEFSPDSTELVSFDAKERTLQWKLD